MTQRTSIVLWGLLTFLSLGVALASYRYLSPHPLGAAPNVVTNLMARPWLMVHAGLAATALLLGPFQFLSRVRAARPRLHRGMGRVYVVACIGGGIAGLILATGATSGPIAQWGFGVLAVSWVTCAVQAWRLALARRFPEHREWMIRSFALTFAAVTLRLYLPIAPILGYPFVDGYRASAWLCWVPNLLAAELYLRAARRPQPALARA